MTDVEAASTLALIVRALPTKPLVSMKLRRLLATLALELLEEKPT